MEFQVDEMISEGYFSGRNCGDEIPVGFIFRKLVKYKFIGEINSLERIDLDEISNINLKLIGVDYCRREIECVPRGHTALIRLEGDKSQALFTQLNSLKKHEYVSLIG